MNRTALVPLGRAMTASSLAGTRSPHQERPPPSNRRVAGLDAARGLALIGMLAVHVFPTFDTSGAPSPATTIAGGRSAATFAVVCGIGLALLTGGRRAFAGRERLAATTGIVVRALFLALVGLGLGYVTVAAGLDAFVILTYYAVIFLLAIPLFGLRPQVLAAVSLGLAVVAPFAVFVRGAPDPALAMSPRPGDALQHPFALVIELILTGAYPAVAWTAYLCAGLAIGRLDLSSRRLGWFLVGSGVAVALAAWWTSWLLLYRAGGLQHIRDALPPGQHWSDMGLRS